MVIKRINKIYLISLEEFISSIETSHSINEALIKMGCFATPEYYRYFHKRAEHENIDYIKLLGIKALPRPKIDRVPLNIEYFIKDSPATMTVIKRRIKRFKLLEYRCQICGLLSIWNKQPITLQIDHINGDHTDNRLENLRYLCPNCHSQTETYAGKGVKNRKPKVQKIKTRRKPSVRNVQWASKEELEMLLQKTSWAEIARMFNVSHTTVRRWAKAYKIL